MKYRIQVNETLKSTRFIEIDYTGDIDELLDAAESNSKNCDDVGYELSKLGAKILEDSDLSISDIHEWETDSLDYQEQEDSQ